MAGMNSPVKSVRLRNNKTIAIQDLPPEAWTVVFGGESGGDLSDYYHKVSWTFRAVDLRASAILQMPFSIYQGDKIIDNSQDYQNSVGFLDNPGGLFSLLEMALVVWGKAYLFKRPNVLNTPKPFSLRYLLPTSVRHKIDKDTGEITFIRDVKGKPENFTTKEISYFWKPDPFVELGPPNGSALQAAASAAGVTLNVDKFADAYFDRGAIKATLLAVQGTPPKEEKERIKTLWQRVMSGIANAFGEMVINAESLTPIIVGEGLESLSDNNLTNEKREAIATAIGIPYSMLFSSSVTGMGGGGIASEDKLTFYESTIVPECRFIESVLNPQVFVPAGYRIRFNEETLDVFQEDEAQRAEALTMVQQALSDPESFLIASQILGYEFSPEIEQAIQSLIVKKDERRERMEQIQPQPPQFISGNGNMSREEQQELRSWQKWAVKQIEQKGEIQRDFEAFHVSPVLAGALNGSLNEAKTVDDVKNIFGNVWLGYP